MTDFSNNGDPAGARRVPDAPQPGGNNGGNYNQHDPATAPASRVRKTHKPELMSLIDSLDLRAKLSLNSKIEARNEARQVKLWEWRSNPQGDEPDSDNESLITIPEEVLTNLEDPLVLESLAPVLPLFIKNELAMRKRRRASDAGLSAPQTQESLINKRRCVDGFLLKDTTQQAIADVPIPQIYYDTADANIYIPLHFFESSALQYVRRNESEIIHDSKSIRNVKVLDVKTLSKTFNTGEDQQSFTYERFLNAANNMVRFQTAHDKHGDTGPWASSWYHHFRFFMTKADAGVTYAFWRAHELNLRLDLWHLVRGFDAAAYTQVYLLAQTFRTAQALMPSTSHNIPPFSSSPAASSSKGRANQNTPSNQSVQSFRTQNKNSNSGGNPTCVICCGAHNGYTHCANRLKDSFPDGKPTWIKSGSGKPLSPGGDEICLKFNTLSLKDSRDNKSCGSTHDANRLHVCSFCGANDHGAFHWKCRQQRN